MLLPCASLRGRAALGCDAQRRIAVVGGTLWGHFARQTTAKGQDFMSPQSAGAGWSQGGIPLSDIALIAVMLFIGPAAPGPAKAPATRPMTANTASKRDKAESIAIIQHHTKGRKRKDPPTC